MSDAPQLLRRILGAPGLAHFFCPGCKTSHHVRLKPDHPEGWDFNGDFTRPNLYPSVLVETTRFTEKGWRDYEEWCAAGHPKLPPGLKFDSEAVRCHSFVENGHIRFLTDCTHPLAGQTVPLEPFPVPEEDAT